MIDLRKIVDHILAGPLPQEPFVAALPMYDWPEQREQVDALWDLLRDEMQSKGINAPEHLARCNADLPAVPGGIRNRFGEVIAPDPAMLAPDAFDLAVLWQHPNLLFAQTCWGPLELWLNGRVRIVGQEDYAGIEGGDGELYTSAIIMREMQTHGSLASLLAGKRFAYNVADSMSGYLSVKRDIELEGAHLGVVSELVKTDGHRNSVRAVADGRADAAAIDCKTWALAQKFEPKANRLKVVWWTRQRLGLPFVTANSA
jgi:ABC-type phosphate/phosphonate transport system substrate-binding protein